MFANLSLIRCGIIPLFFLACGLFASVPAEAGEADVVAAKYARTADGGYRFDVSVRHADAGWEHYADKWQVIGPGGTVLGERVLVHPHDTEQPFTRSLSGIAIPVGVGSVTIRAHDTQHGWGGAELDVELGE
ncbi:MAG: hypothetical protein Q8O63_06925 [Hoeflea sp.]|nr:hypothetical protein [Hoeflea sp.]